MPSLAEEALDPLARRATGYIIASDQGPSALRASPWSRRWVDGEVGLDELVDLGLHVVANRPQIRPGNMPSTSVADQVVAKPIPREALSRMTFCRTPSWM